MINNVNFFSYPNSFPLCQVTKHIHRIQGLGNGHLGDHSSTYHSNFHLFRKMGKLQQRLSNFPKPYLEDKGFRISTSSTVALPEMLNPSLLRYGDSLQLVVCASKTSL